MEKHSLEPSKGLWEKYKRFYRYGLITPLVDARDTLLDWVENRWLDDEEEFLRLQAISAQVSCLLLRRSQAVRSLVGFIFEGKEEREKALSELRGNRDISPLVKGIVLSNIGNTLYRHLDHISGLQYTNEAEGFFELAQRQIQHQKQGYNFVPATLGMQERKSYEDKIDCLIFQSENRIWHCRLLWQIINEDKEKLNKLEQIEELLNKTVEELATVYRESKPDPRLLAGVDLRLAMTFELWAVLLFTEQKLEAALRRAYRAAFLLRNRRSIKDIVRLSFLFYSLGRVEGTKSRRKYVWGIDLEEQALENFKRLQKPKEIPRPFYDEEDNEAAPWEPSESEGEMENPLEHPHPFYARTLAQLCQLRIKAGYIEEDDTEGSLTKMRLRETEEAVAKLESIDPIEGRYARGQWQLAEVWYKQAKARKSGKNKGEWGKVLEASELLPDCTKERVPRTLKYKRQLHRGLALVHLGEEQRKEGRKELKEGIEGARKIGELKMEVACTLALTESLFDDNRQEAFSLLNEAFQLLRRVESTFLEKWAQDLAGLLDMPVSVNLNQDYTAAKREFEEAYLRFHLARGQERTEEIIKATGLERSTFYRKSRPLRKN